MLNFTDVSLRRGARVLFSGATFSIFRSEKVGITGANGTGKSSLLSLVRGELQTEHGTLEMPPGLAIASVSQELSASDTPAVEFVMDGDAALRDLERAIAAAAARDHGLHLAELHARYRAIGGYDARSRAGRLMHGLGFDDADGARAVRTFSGGWRVRLNLAQALMCRADLLLLDEPTNHLDLDAIIWLETWLSGYAGTLLLISHDREFLDRIAERIVHLEHSQARAYRGNYSAFEEQRASELAREAALFERQQREIRHMEGFVERFRAKASKARQAQSRLKALERMQRIAPAHVDSSIGFSFAQPAKLPRPLLALQAAAAGYDDQPLLTCVNLTLSPGDRLAILGRNGAGKSTLMKLLAGELGTLDGERTAARELRIGYFAQHQLEQLDGRASPIENLRRLGGDVAAVSTEQELRDFLAGFAFRGDRVFEQVGPFSGGEKARLVLACIACMRPNLLLLDEPTNHLDLQMRQALAVALQDYAGAVVLVSHDRHLLRTVADAFELVHEGHVAPFEGDLEDYAKWSGEPSMPSGEEANAAAQSAQSRRQRRREQAERRNQLTPLRTRIAEYDLQLARLSEQAAAITAELATAELYQESARERLRALLQQRSALVRETERIESAWLDASEELETRLRR